jgi:hypothetical protein
MLSKAHVSTNNLFLKNNRSHRKTRIQANYILAQDTFVKNLVKNPIQSKNFMTSSFIIMLMKPI